MAAERRALAKPSPAKKPSAGRRVGQAGSSKTESKSAKPAAKANRTAKARAKASAKASVAKPMETVGEIAATTMKALKTAPTRAAAKKAVKTARTRASAKRRSPQARSFKRVEAVVNPASGSVGPGAAAALAEILEAYGVSANIVEVSPGEVVPAVRAAVNAKPDLVITLAGDGTAGLAATLCGPDGPLVAPLAGGTMNMLPFAVFGERPWAEALVDTLERGEAIEISGGEVDGKPFYVAAILGQPALLAHAREAVRAGHPIEALGWVRNVWKRAFSSHLRFAANGERGAKTEALALICPLISRAVSDDKALEAVVLDPKNVAQAFRLGVRAALADVLGDWRSDPAVEATRLRRGEAWATARIPAILDGEPIRLPRRVKIAFKPVAFRAFAAKPLPEPPKAPDLGDLAG